MKINWGNIVEKIIAAIIAAGLIALVRYLYNVVSGKASASSWLWGLAVLVVSIGLASVWRTFRELLNVLGRWIIDNWKLVLGLLLIIVMGFSLWFLKRQVDALEKEMTSAYTTHTVQARKIETLTTPSNTATPTLTLTSTFASPPTSTSTSTLPAARATDTPTVTPTNIPPATATDTSTPTPTPTWVLLRSFPAPQVGLTGLVRVDDNIWVSIPDGGRLYRLNLEGKSVAEFKLPIDQWGGLCQGGLAWDGNSLWFANCSAVHQLDPLSGQELTSFEVEMDSIIGIAWDGQALLMIDGEGNLVRYDRAGQRLRRFAVKSPHGGVTGMGWVKEELWVVGVFGDLLRFDNSGFEIIGSFYLGQCTAATFPYHLALYWDGGSLWVADLEGNRISQYAPTD